MFGGFWDDRPLETEEHLSSDGAGEGVCYARDEVDGGRAVMHP
jgi:hypothetical protein